MLRNKIDPTKSSKRRLTVRTDTEDAPESFLMLRPGVWRSRGCQRRLIRHIRFSEAIRFARFIARNLSFPPACRFAFEKWDV
jgi:hypothetical protein